MRRLPLLEESGSISAPVVLPAICFSDGHETV